jgi:hypothetical protein
LKRYPRYSAFPGINPDGAGGRPAFQNLMKKFQPVYFKRIYRPPKDFVPLDMNCVLDRTGNEIDEFIRKAVNQALWSAKWYSSREKNGELILGSRQVLLGVSDSPSQ